MALQLGQKAHMVLYSAIFFSIGLLAGSIGPVIPYLASHRNVPQTEYSFLFMTRTIGSILGFALLKIIEKQQLKHTEHRIITLGLAVNAACILIFIQGESKLWAGLSIAVIQSGHYTVLTAANICLLLIAKGKAGQYITFVNAVFAVGAMLSPLALAQVGIPSFYAIAACYLLVGLMAMTLRPPSQPNSSIKSQQEPQMRQASTKLAILVALGMFLTSGIESTVNGWMPTYAVSSGMFDMKEATISGTLFWSMSTILRFLSTAVPLPNSSKLRILITCIFLCSLACLLLHLLQQYYWLVLAGSLAYGFSCSAVFPLILSISTQYSIRFRPDQLSTMMITPSFSSFFVAGLTGVCMHYSMGMLFLCLVAASAALLIDSTLFFKEMEQNSTLKGEQSEQEKQRLQDNDKK